MQKRRNVSCRNVSCRNILWGWSFSLLTLLTLVLFAFGAPVRLHASDGNAPAVVRLSYVDGAVQLFQGKDLQFQQAQVNMPLLEGSRVQTGEDGRAELEFDDGSVARLTPNSSLLLLRVHPMNRRSPVNDMELLSGLGYFELNVTEGQRFTVRFRGMSVRPTDNSIFRINLDSQPEVAVVAGAVQVNGAGDLHVSVPQNGNVRLNPESPSQYMLADGVTPDTWDRWNADRDNEIAQQAQDQTSARDNTQNPNDPGWNDLDAYGDWYPMEGYGDVWVPDGVDQGWDPFGYGAWADYPGMGYVWVSGYPWGWLPYHCGAWNYFNSFGWGWIPGQCGIGWEPVVGIWNGPYGYVPPPRPRVRGPIVRHIYGGIIPVDRGPGARGPWGPGSPRSHPGRVDPERVRTIRVNGRSIQPLPARSRARLDNGSPNGGPDAGSGVVLGNHVGAPPRVTPGPVQHQTFGPPSRQGPTPGGHPGIEPQPNRPPVVAPRPPVNSPSPAPPRVWEGRRPSQPAPAPRVEAPPPRMEPAPAPRVESPPAPRAETPSNGGKPH